MSFKRFGAIAATSMLIATGASTSPVQADPVCPEGWYLNQNAGWGTSELSSCGTIIGETGTTTVSIPEGVTKIQYIVLGGGGGGGAGGGTYAAPFDLDTLTQSESGDLKAGGGGAGGSVERGELNLTAPIDLTVVVGAGGASGSGSGSTGTDGAAGGNSSLSDGTTTVTANGGAGGKSGSNGGDGGSNADYSGGDGLQNPGSDIHIAGGGGGAGAGASGTSVTTATTPETAEGKTTDIVAGDGGAGVTVHSDDWAYFDSNENRLYGGDMDWEVGFGPDVNWDLGAGGAGGSAINAAYGLGDTNGCDWEVANNQGVSGNTEGMNQSYGQGACIHRMNYAGDGYPGGWFTAAQSVASTLEYNFDTVNRNADSYQMNPGAGGPGGAGNDWENIGIATGAPGNAGLVMIRFLSTDDGSGGGDNGGGSDNGGSDNNGAGESAAVVKVAITGYVQKSRSHTNDILLSKKRAKAVRSYLKANGLEDATFTIKGKGVKGKKWNARTAIAKISWTGATTGKTQSRVYFDKWSAKLDKGDKKKLKRAISKVPGA